MTSNRATPPSSSTAPTEKLLTIIAAAYQIAGAHDAPAHILDVLANPEAATDEQVEAMLPYVSSTGLPTPHGPEIVKGLQNALAAALDKDSTAPTVEADEDLRIARHAVFNLKEFREGRSTFPSEALGILDRCLDRLASRPPAEAAGERERELCATIGAMQAQIDALTGDLAVRSAGDAERFRRAIALEDNAEMLYSVVLNNAPDVDAIRREFDSGAAPAPGNIAQPGE